MPAVKRAGPADQELKVLEDKFRAYFPVGEAVAALLHPFAEVVLHDIASGKIVRLWNAFSSRKPGDPSHLEGAPDLFTDSQLTLGPYEKALPSQGRTKSTTAALVDESGEKIGFLCFNLEVTKLDNLITLVQAFVQPEIRRPEPIYRNDLQEHINYTVRDYLKDINKTIDTLSREERRGLVAVINESGLFQARNAVQMVATAIKVSRASVYNLLNELRESDPEGTTRLDIASTYPRSSDEEEV